MDAEKIFKTEVDLFLAILKRCEESNFKDDIPHTDRGSSFYLTHHFFEEYGIHIYTAIPRSSVYFSKTIPKNPYHRTEDNPMPLKSIITDEEIGSEYIKKSLQENHIESMLLKDNQKRVAIISNGNSDSLEEIRFIFGKLYVLRGVGNGKSNEIFPSTGVRETKDEKKVRYFPAKPIFRGNMQKENESEENKSEENKSEEIFPSIFVRITAKKIEGRYFPEKPMFRRDMQEQYRPVELKGISGALKAIEITINESKNPNIKLSRVEEIHKNIEIIAGQREDESEVKKTLFENNSKLCETISTLEEQAGELEGEMTTVLKKLSEIRKKIDALKKEVADL